MILARYPSFAKNIKDFGHYELVRAVNVSGPGSWSDIVKID